MPEVVVPPFEPDSSSSDPQPESVAATSATITSPLQKRQLIGRAAESNRVPESSRDTRMVTSARGAVGPGGKTWPPKLSHVLRSRSLVALLTAEAISSLGSR